MPRTPGVFDPGPLPSVGFAGSLSFTFYFAARPTVPPGWTLEPGRRDHAVLWLISEGTLHLHTPSGGVDLTPGTLVHFPPGSSPVAENRSQCRATRYVLSFLMRVWGELDFFRLYRVPAIRRVRRPETLTEPWEQLLAQIAAHEGAVTLGAEGWARVLVDRWLTELQEAGELRRAPAADDRLTAALAAIDADLRDEWSMARLSEVMHLSPVRVRQLFTQAVGVPPTRYVTLRRIAHARDLLAHTELSSVEIAQRCGFDDPRHFSRVFFRITGMRPTRYREQTRMTGD
jgi:AraC-like DNA-binding protein